MTTAEQISAIDERIWSEMVSRYGLANSSAMVLGLILDAARDLSALGMHEHFLASCKDAIRRAEELVEQQRRPQQ